MGDENLKSANQVTALERVFSILAYFGVLWFLGMLPTSARDSVYVKNHVNNGIILFITEAALACIPFVGWVAEIALVVVAIMGIVQAAMGEEYKLPFIGDKLRVYY